MSLFKDIARESKEMENTLRQGNMMQTQGVDSRVDIQKGLQTGMHQIFGKALGMSLGEKANTPSQQAPEQNAESTGLAIQPEKKTKRAPTRFPSMTAHQATGPAQEQISRDTPPMGPFSGNSDLINEN